MTAWGFRHLLHVERGDHPGAEHCVIIWNSNFHLKGTGAGIRDSGNRADVAMELAVGNASV